MLVDFFISQYDFGLGCDKDFFSFCREEREEGGGGRGGAHTEWIRQPSKNIWFVSPDQLFSLASNLQHLD